MSKTGRKVKYQGHLTSGTLKKSFFYSLSTPNGFCLIGLLFWRYNEFIRTNCWTQTVTFAGCKSFCVKFNSAKAQRHWPSRTSIRLSDGKRLSLRCIQAVIWQCNIQWWNYNEHTCTFGFVLTAIRSRSTTVPVINRQRATRTASLRMHN